MDHKKIPWEDYPLQTYDKIRFADLDRQGHVNNAVFSTYFETGRVEFFYAQASPLLEKENSFVVASNHMELIQQLTWPGRVEIATGVLAIGRSSIRLLQALFQNGILAALSEIVIVQLGPDGQKSKTLSPWQKERLEKYLLKKEERKG